MKTVLISGATSGFGRAAARIFASKGDKLILTGRRTQRLIDLSNELEDEFGIEVLSLSFDIRDRSRVKEIIGKLPEDWTNIDILVNNAGLASGFDDIQNGDIDDWDAMIDTNVKGLLYLSRAVMPLMIDRAKGHIINIGSTAGKEVYTKGNVYCASKHAVDAISKAMRIDLLGKNIKVTQICPGAAETEFALVRFHGDEEKAKSVYKGYQPMTDEDIANQIYYVTTLPDHLCINDMVLTSLAQANSFYVHKD